MKLYVLMFCICNYSYQIQSADASLPLGRAAVLKAKLNSVKESDRAYFKALSVFNEPAKFPIKPAHERALCQRLFDADRQMHQDALIFIRHAYKMKDPDIVDYRLFTPRAVSYSIKKMKERPLTPQSSASVTEFFKAKESWVQLQDTYKQAHTTRKDSEFSD